LGQVEPEIRPSEDGYMSDPQALLTSLVVTATVLASVTLVLSRIIPDEYDRRAPVRRRIDPAPRRDR
jgi:hypothetical protein